MTMPPALLKPYSALNDVRLAASVNFTTDSGWSSYT